MRVWLLTIALSSVALAAFAQAGPGDTSAGMFFDFEQLRANRLGDRIEIRYTIGQQTWNAAQRAGIRPTLVAEVLSTERGGTVNKLAIVQRTGRFLVNLPVDKEPQAVRFALLHKQVNGFRRNGVGVVTLTARLGSDVAARPARPAARQAAKAPAARPVKVTNDAMRACGRYGKDTKACRTIVMQSRNLAPVTVDDCGGFGKGLRLQCLRHAARGKVQLSSAIRACAGRFTQPSARVECVRRAAVARTNPAAGIYSCGAQFKNDARALDCVARIGYARANTQGLVDTCSSAFGAAQPRLDCIGVGARAQTDISEAVLACAQAMPWQSSRRQCIEAAAQSKVDLTSAIGACRSHAVRPEVVLRCVRYASQGANPAMANAINGCGRSAGNDSAFSSCVAQAASN